MRILVVDDDLLTIEGLKTILGGLSYAVESATTGQAAWDLIESFSYDLLLLDVLLPDLNGIELCRRLRTEGGQMPVMLLTGRDSPHEKAIGLDAGADDYLVKPFDPEELVARVRALLRRSTVTITPILEWGELQLDPSTCQVSYSNRPLALTPKEYALLELFLRNNRRVFSCGAILDHLWSFEETPGEEAVRTHIKGLRQKLKSVGAPSDLIDTVYGIGYRLKPLEESAAATSKTTKPVMTGEQVKQQTLTAIAGVWERFQGRILEQVSLLEQAANQLVQGNCAIEIQLQARREAHTLAGSLGTFGFPEASQLARQIETYLEQSVISLEQARQLQHWVRAMQKLLAQPLNDNSHATPLIQSEDRSRPLLLVVDADRSLASLLEQEADNWGIQARIVPDAKVARRVISQQRPDVVLLDPVGSTQGKSKFNQDDNLVLLNELSRQTPPLPVLVFTAEGHQMERLEVVRRGGRAFLQKPASPEQVFQAVLQVLDRTEPYTARILAVDDDPQILATLQTLLEPWGLKVTTLSDPRKFWETLEAMPPDLLILDICMPHLNGIELCQIVRNDPRWNGIPILFLTAQTDPTLVNQVFAAGADDFINKPIVGPELLARLLTRLERTHWLRRLTDTDPLTGVWNRHKSSQILENYLKLAQQHPQPFSFAVLDLDHLRQINDRYGHAMGDAVLKRLGNLLHQSFQGEDVVARWGGEEFVVGMYGIDQSDAQKRLLQVLTTFHAEEFTAPDQALQASIKFRATFSAAVAQYPAHGTDLRSLYRAADTVLYQVKSRIDRSNLVQKQNLSQHLAIVDPLPVHPL